MIIDKATIVNANRVITLNNANPKAYKILIKALKNDNQPSKANTMLQQAKMKGLRLNKKINNFLKKICE